LPEGKPIAGVHLVKAFDGPNNPSKADEELATDCVDILRSGLRGGPDCDVGGAEEAYITTRDLGEMQRTEHEFVHALAKRIREVLPWADGRAGLTVSDLKVAPGWHFMIRDTEGRPYDVQITFSEIYEIASAQRKQTFGNFRKTLDLICNKLRDARVSYFTRRDAVELQ
jgi:hypothetical protein